MLMMSARASCFDNPNLRVCIAEYLDYGDLCALELTSQAWCATTAHSYSVLRKSPRYHHMTFKNSSLYNTHKRQCARVYNSRTSVPDKLLLIGGSFGSPFTDTCVFSDGRSDFHGTISRSLNPPIKIGSAAFVQDMEDNMLFLGGWNDTTEVRTTSQCSTS